MFSNDSETKMCIYRIRHLESDQSYIGQTTKKVNIRWLDHCRPKSECTKLKNAIQKYGREAFEFTVIETCETIDQLNEREVHWIKELNTLSPNGYNLEVGGKNKIPCEETRKKMSARKIGVPHSLEHRKNLAEANYKRLGGVKRSEEFCRNLSIKNSFTSQEIRLKIKLARDAYVAKKDLENPPTEKTLKNRAYSLKAAHKRRDKKIAQMQSINSATQAANVTSCTTECVE